MQFTKINGFRYGFASLSVAVNGTEQPKVFKSVDWKAEQTKGVVDSNQVEMAGRTRGYGRGTGSFSMLKSEWNDLQDQLTQGGFIPTMDAFFDIVLQFSENFETDVLSVVLRGCNINSISQNAQNGTDAITTECEITIARIEDDGTDLFANQ